MLVETYIYHNKALLASSPETRGFSTRITTLYIYVSFLLLLIIIVVIVVILCMFSWYGKLIYVSCILCIFLIVVLLILVHMYSLILCMYIRALE